MKYGALLWLRFGSYIPLVIKGYLFYNRKTDAGAGWVFFNFQPFKNVKDLFGMVLFKANSFIGETDLVVCLIFE